MLCAVCSAVTNGAVLCSVVMFSGGINRVVMVDEAMSSVGTCSVVMCRSVL